MVVQHNLTAMNANRMLGITTGQQAKSSEKLSSGYRINRAADDAAGLSISEKMRKQIKGLTQASTNAQDGISCVQTAEGALTEVHSMLQRMNELAVQSSNGTLTDETDRQAIQDEIDQLVTEIDRVSETTKFNDMYLLKGDRKTTDAAGMTASYKTAPTATPAMKDADFTALGDLYLKDSTTKLTKDELLKLVELDENGAAKFKDGVEIYSVAADDAGQFGAQLSTTIKNTDVLAKVTTTTTALRTGADATAAATAADLTDEELKGFFNEDGTRDTTKKLFAQKTDGTWAEVGAEQIADFVNVTPAQEATDSGVLDLEFKLHVGSESDDTNKISVKIKAMSAKGIGVDVLKKTGLMTQDDATAAIDTISDAIQQVSSQRSALGAVQNRLEHTIANLDNVVENTTAAESRIRDTDMAKEMVEYSKNNILAQAGQSMLAQANQSTQGVLSLLQ